jgi:hypothetical protein
MNNNIMQGLLRKTEQNDWVIVYENCDLPLHMDDIDKVQDIKDSNVYFDIISNYEINGWRTYAKLIEPTTIADISFEKSEIDKILEETLKSYGEFYGQSCYFAGKENKNFLPKDEFLEIYKNKALKKILRFINTFNKN